MKIYVLTTALLSSALCSASPQSDCSEQSLANSSAVNQWLSSCTGRPTSNKTVLRSNGGKFGDPRPRPSDPDKKHDGIDVVLHDYARMCLENTKLYTADDMAVRSIADGVIAYSRINSSRTCPTNRPNCDPLTETGLGFTVIVDHENSVYSLYAHLADDRLELNRCLANEDELAVDGATMPKKVGDRVKQGEIIGYLGEVGQQVGRLDGPTGNAVATQAPSQVHIEIFIAAPGKRSRGLIRSIVPASDRGRIDPSVLLNRPVQVFPALDQQRKPCPPELHNTHVAETCPRT